jgi:hypothetical protein
MEGNVMKATTQTNPPSRTEVENNMSIFPTKFFLPPNNRNEFSPTANPVTESNVESKKE